MHLPTKYRLVYQLILFKEAAAFIKAGGPVIKPLRKAAVKRFEIEPISKSRYDSRLYWPTVNKAYYHNESQKP